MIRRAVALALCLPATALAQPSMPVLSVLAMCGVDGPSLQARMDEFAAIGWQPAPEAARAAAARQLGAQEIARQGLLTPEEALDAREARLAALAAAALPAVEGTVPGRTVLVQPDGSTLLVVHDSPTAVTCTLSAPLDADALAEALPWDRASRPVVQATLTVFAPPGGRATRHVAFADGAFAAPAPFPVTLLPPVAIDP